MDTEKTCEEMLWLWIEEYADAKSKGEDQFLKAIRTGIDGAINVIRAETIIECLGKDV
jgi:hypothetical protein